jgi:gliding motility-associated-like protein
VTYTVADASGNTTNCSFTVTVVDNEAPTISCPSVVSVNNDLGVCGAVVNAIAPISSGDNCSVASVTYALTGATTGSGSNDASGETFNLGVTTVTYTVTDAQGLASSCSFNVSVQDSEAPNIIACPSNITQCETIASWFPPTATDNCGVASITQTQGPSSGSTFPVGITNISYDIIDNSGNVENCAFTVNVLPPIDSHFWIPDTLCLATAVQIDLDDSTNLNLSIPETDIFYSDSSQVVINSDNLLLPLSTGEGTYPITHVVDNGYCTDTTSFIITLLPIYQSAFSGLDTICAASDTFNLASLFDGATTEGGQFFSPSGANIIQDTLWLLSGSSGVYDIGYAVGVGFCADTTYRQIYLSPDVDPSWQLAIDSICESNPLIDLQPFVTGTYNTTSLFSAQGITGNIFDPSGLLGEQVITYQVGEGQCQESLKDTLFIIDNPSLDAGPDLEICGDTVELYGTSDSNITWWSSSNDIAIIDSTLLNGAVANLLVDEGDYTIYLNSDNGYCFGIDSLNISFYTPPNIIDAGPDQVLDYTFSTYFDALSPDYGFGTWKGQNNSDIIDPNNPISEVNNLEVGENVFYWIIQNGVCPLDSADVIISVRDIIIPEGFSPNGDNKNDFFTIPGIQNASSSEVKIFNRWGNEIYQSVSYKNDWNGENQSGEALPDDTYYYIIFIEERKFSGYIIIRR